MLRMLLRGSATAAIPQPLAWALGPLIKAPEAVVCPRYLVGHGHLPTADPADSGDGVVRRAKGPVIPQAPVQLCALISIAPALSF